MLRLAIACFFESSSWFQLSAAALPKKNIFQESPFTCGRGLNAESLIERRLALTATHSPPIAAPFVHTNIDAFFSSVKSGRQVMQQMCRSTKQNSVVFSGNILFFSLGCVFTTVRVRNTQVQHLWKVRIMTGLKQTQRRFTKRGLHALFIYHICLFFFFNKSFFPTWSRRRPRNLGYLIILGTLYQTKNEYTKSVYSGRADTCVCVCGRAWGGGGMYLLADRNSHLFDCTAYFYCLHLWNIDVNR